MHRRNALYRAVSATLRPLRLALRRLLRSAAAPRQFIRALHSIGGVACSGLV
jgi:hypothetical protein